jgi:hypothetical protein
MEENEIEITIGAKGEISGEVFRGPGGEGCFALLDEILAELGEGKQIRRAKAEGFSAPRLGKKLAKKVAR